MNFMPFGQLKSFLKISANRAIEDGEILCVFSAFDTEEWTEKIRSQPQMISPEFP